MGKEGADGVGQVTPVAVRGKKASGTGPTGIVCDVGMHEWKPAAEISTGAPIALVTAMA
jgi:hypothetical protein